MPNGHAAIAALATDLPPALADTPVEQRIGAAMADAAVAISLGMACFARTGEISLGVKQRGGEALAEVAELQLYADDDTAFAAVATKEGRKALELRHGSMLRRELGTTKVDVAFDALLANVLTISSRVVGVERALRAN